MRKAPLAATTANLQHERDLILRTIKATIPAWTSMVGSNVEVVLHDLERPAASVIFIANGHVTGRKIGDSLLGGPADDKAFLAAKKELVSISDAKHSVVVDYPTHSPAGALLKSATVVFRDSAGEPFLALCLNADLSFAKQAMAWFGAYLGDQEAKPAAAEVAPPSPVLFAAQEAPDLDALMRSIIDEAVQRLGKPVRDMTRDEKLEALKAMMGRGVLMVRGGVERVAKTLGVTRYTVYNYIDLLREREGVGRDM